MTITWRKWCSWVSVGKQITFTNKLHFVLFSINLSLFLGTTMQTQYFCLRVHLLIIINYQTQTINNYIFLISALRSLKIMNSPSRNSGRCAMRSRSGTASKTTNWNKATDNKSVSCQILHNLKSFKITFKNKHLPRRQETVLQRG